MDIQTAIDIATKDWDVVCCEGHKQAAKTLASEVKERRLDAFALTNVIGLLSRIREWDHLDSSHDGEFWKNEIDSTIKAWLPRCIFTRNEDLY